MKESIIYGLFGGLIGSLYMGWICSPKSSQCRHGCLAVVDMQVLIAKKSQQLAKTLVPETRASETLVPESLGESRQIVTLPSVDHRLRASSIREAGDDLREDLKTFATTHNLILLAKGVVMGGDLPDKTEEILAWFEKGDQQ